MCNVHGKLFLWFSFSGKFSPCTLALSVSQWPLRVLQVEMNIETVIVASEGRAQSDVSRCKNSNLRFFLV